MSDLVPVFDPPLGSYGGGTNVAVEVRFADLFAFAELYDPIEDDAYDSRGNLLNPNYACEAYRYATGTTGATPINDGNPRVPAGGLTPYVAPDDIDQVRDPASQLLPRYMNFRLIIESNVDATPAIVPALRDFSLVYRMAPN